MLAKLDPEATEGKVWAKAAAGVDITALRSELRDAVAPITGAEVGGGLSAKASYNEFLDRLLLVTTMLLAIAVLIALIGIGNTLGLSVLERIRESALLRALGLQSRQLRWMLAIEAVLLSLSATVVGIAAGVSSAGSERTQSAANSTSTPSTSPCPHPKHSQSPQ
jgi:putative ABC transport system permease protein